MPVTSEEKKVSSATKSEAYNAVAVAATTTGGGDRRSRKTFERGLEDLHGERPSTIIRSGKGWECSVQGPD
jgi:hypothetical protein